MSRFVFLISFACFAVAICDSARILAVFPVPSISHQIVFRPLTQDLVKRGHEVVVLTTDPAFPKGATPKNLTEIDLHDVSYKAWIDNIRKVVSGDKNDLYLQMVSLYNVMNIIMEKQIKSDEVQRMLQDKTEKFDLLLMESNARPLLIFSHIYKIPVIQVSSLGAMLSNLNVLGIPTHPLLYPNMFNRRVYNLTMWEKISEVYLRFSLLYFDYLQLDVHDAMLKRNFGSDVPSLSELSENVGMLFVNLHPIWEGNYPVSPNVIYLGGLHQKPSKELPQDLKMFLDSSKHGVIYVSFGTNMLPSTLPAKKIEMFVKTFSELPYNILWKWDKDVLPGQSENIRIAKWFPQSDLLKHPNVKLFITQGGLQSTDEAITAGVPLIAFPMLGDQWFNAEKYIFHKIGLKLEMETFTESDLKNAINGVINDPSYIENIKRLSRLMNDQPMSALDRAMWWIEHVLRHGTRHLRSPAHNISWAQYLELELVFSLLALVLISFIGLVTALYLILRLAKSKKKMKRN